LSPSFDGEPSSTSPAGYTRPRRPQTNGKAEALVKTLLREWAYRFAYRTSAHRARALPGYLRWDVRASSIDLADEQVEVSLAE
jgi:hypothetical protein